MDSVIAVLLGLMRRARFVFTIVYLAAAVGLLAAYPGSGWTWFIIVAGALLCALFWVLVKFWAHIFMRQPGGDGANGRES